MQKVLENKKNLLLIPIIMIGLVFTYFTGSKILNSLQDTLNEENETSDDGISEQQEKSDDEIGQFTLTWMPGTDGRTGTLDPDNSAILTVNPADNNSYDSESSTGGGAVATYQLMFNMGGNASAPAGSVKIKIPRYIFYQRDNTPAEQTIDLPLVQYPEQSGTEFNYRYETDEDGVEWILLENYKEIPSTFSFECSISYTLVTPSTVADAYEKEIKGYATLDLDLNDEIDDESESNPLTLKYASHAQINTVSESYDTHYDDVIAAYTNVYQFWNESWPKELKPSNADDYFYAIWYYRATVSYATQPYSITLTSEVTDDLGGEILAYCSDDECTGSSNKTYTNGITYKKDKPSATSDSYGYNSVIVKYPREKLGDEQTHTISNQIKAVVTGVDGAVSEKTAKASNEYKFVKLEYTEETIYPPGDIPTPDVKLTKTDNLSSSDSTIIGGINKLELDNPDPIKLRFGNQSNNYSFNIYSTVQSFLYTYKGSGETSNPANYGYTKYKYNLVDENVALGNETSGYEFLKKGDYEMTKFYLYSMSLTDYKDTETKVFDKQHNKTTITKGWQTVPNTDYANWPEVKIYYKTDEEYNLLGTIKVKYQSETKKYEFTDLEGNTKILSSSSQVDLPAGTIGLKAVAETNTYSVALDMYYTVNLINSDHVLEIIKDKDSATLYNFAESYATNAADKVIGQEKLNPLTTYFSAYFAANDIAKYGVRVQRDYDSNTLNRMKEISGNTRQNKWVNYVNDPSKRRVKANYTAYAYDYKEYDKSLFEKDDIFDDNIIVEQRNGTFYDLLPKGMTADLDSVKAYTFDAKSSSLSSTSSNIADTGDEINVKTTLIDNYRNTGRTMLVVNAEVPEEVSNRQSVYYDSPNRYYAYSGITLRFTGLYSWDNIYDYGNMLLNSIAYKSGSGALSAGYPDDTSTLSSSFEDKKYFSDLDSDGNPAGTLNDTVYAQRELSFSVNTASNSAFDKTVKTSTNQDYVDGRDGDVVATAGGYYTYRLRYASQRNINTTGLIVYDQLESYSDDTLPNRWKGKFVSIDVSHAESKGVAPVIYYSTKTNLNLYEYGKASIDQELPKDADITNTDIWSTTPPTDLSKVTAIAVDYSKDKDGNDYTIKSEESIVTLVTMQAPTKNVETLIKQKAKAANAAWWFGRTQQGAEAIHSNFSVDEHTEVLIDNAPIDIHKSSEIKSGTKKNPQEVKDGDNIVYDLTISNTSQHELLSNIKVADDMPTVLNVDSKNIAYYIEGIGSKENTILVNSNNFIKLAQSGNSLTFEISQLTGGQVLHILIPTTVKINATFDGSIENSAEIVEFNNIEFTKSSEVTYHYVKIKKPKIPNTLDNVNKFMVLGVVGVVIIAVATIGFMIYKDKNKSKKKKVKKED